MSVTKSVTKEAPVEKHLKTTWESVTGGMCIKFPPLFLAGFPDRICLAPGAVIVFVETKAPGKSPRKLQEKIHRKLRALGFRVEVLDTREAVDAFILSM